MNRIVHLVAAAGVAIHVLHLTSSVGDPLRADEQKETPDNVVFDPSTFQALEYRSIGPYRGSRVTAVTGVRTQRHTFYFGGVGGGVWKSDDAGVRWHNVSDKYFKAGSIGAVAVADSDPNVVYVGTGSACIRANVSPGIGVYKSMDAGKTWAHIGLDDTQHIPRVRIHPTNPDLVYVAALGHAFGPNKQRGIFRSKDGGKTWDQVLYVSDRTGASDLVMDANNPRILYAGMWTAERKPWEIFSGSEEGGLFRTTDGGDTWTELTNGLPAGVTGRIGVTASPARPNRVWAVIEAEEGGVFRSDDGGDTFQRVSADRETLARPFYFAHIYAHPRDEDTVWVVTRPFLKSIDGGKTFVSQNNPFGDNHDLWINPDDPNLWVFSSDGGAYVTLNNGVSWSTYLNQPTAEIYRITTDNQFPYRVYGSQQDAWVSLSMPSRSTSFGAKLSISHLYAVGGMEAGHVAVHPTNPNIIYSGGPSGRITRYDRATGHFRQIKTYPEVSGTAAKNLRYRFQWSAPIRLSPHDPKVVYHMSNYVHRSANEGQTWKVISPDLTRNDKSKQDYPGGPISRELTTAEIYCTIYAFEESPLKPGLLWAGSDDGLVHVSQNGGEKWDNVTPKEMPEWATVNTIELSAHDPGRVFLAVYNYRLDDFKPYIFRTNDYGRTWTLLTDGRNGIPANHFVRVVREDPDRKGLLYAGTEFGMYVSFDDGAHWQSLQLNLPVTPITDLVVKDQDLALSTQGRAFWILDDVTPLHQLTDKIAAAPAHLFKPRYAYRVRTSEEEDNGSGQAPRDLIGGVRIDRYWLGTEPPDGAIIYSYFAEEPKAEVVLEILDSAGKVIRTFSSRDDPKDSSVVARPYHPAFKEESTFHKRGLNRFVWNLRYPGPFELDRQNRLANHNTLGPVAIPGTYQVRLRTGTWSQVQSFELRKDPRLDTTPADFQQQLDLQLQTRDRITEVHHTAATIRDIRAQVGALAQRLAKTEIGAELSALAKTASEKLSALEQELVRTDQDYKHDRLNLPPRLDDQYSELYDYLGTSGGLWRGDARPTDGAYERYKDLRPELEKLTTRLSQVLEVDVNRFNALLRERGVSPVVVNRTTP